MPKLIVIDYVLHAHFMFFNIIHINLSVSFNMEEFKAMVCALHVGNADMLYVPSLFMSDKDIVTHVATLKHYAKKITDSSRKIKNSTVLLSRGKLSRFQWLEIECKLKQYEFQRCGEHYTFYKSKCILKKAIEYKQGIVQWNDYYLYSNNYPTEEDVASEEHNRLLSAMKLAEKALFEVKKQQNAAYKELESRIHNALKQHVIEYVHTIGGVENFVDLRNSILQRRNDETWDAMKHWCIIASLLKGDVLKEAAVYPFNKI